MYRFKNKNTLILIISAVLILVAIIIAISAAANSSDSKADTTESIVSSDSPQATTPVKSYVYTPGKYKVATENNDSLCLRLEPNTSSDRIIYIASGTEIDVIAIWDDWGYTVYGNTGGWLSLNYLELISSNAQTSAVS